MDALARGSASTRWSCGGATSSPPIGIRTRPASPRRGAARSTTTAATTRAAWTWRCEALDLPAARREQARLRAEGRYLGIGLVNYVEATATVPLESAVVRVGPDGGVTVVSGAAPQGQGHVTMFSRLVGRRARRDPGRDRGAAPATPRWWRRAAAPTAAARRPSAAARRCSPRARCSTRRGASPRTCSRRRPPTSCSRAAGSAVRGLPSRAVGWAEVAAAAHAGRVPGETPDLEDTHVFEVSQSSFANGTHAVVLEVDRGDRRRRDPALHRRPRLRPRARARNRRRADPRRRGPGPARRAQPAARLRRRAASASPRR